MRDFPGAGEFDWDEGNAGKIWLRHRVSAAECEQTFFNRPLVVALDDLHSQDEVRYAALGRTDAHRLLFVVYTLRGERLRIVSARDMTAVNARNTNMPKRKNWKPIPRLDSEDAEREFWATHDSTDYLDWTRASSATFSRLKPTTQTISLRLPEPLIANLKMLANKRDVPYQSLLKIFLSERIEQELRSSAAPGRPVATMAPAVRSRSRASGPVSGRPRRTTS